MGTVRLGVDIGGTFTGITVLDEDTGGVTIAKVASRRGDPAGALIEAVARGLERAGVEAADVTMLVHGTTIVTNAILENKLPPAALVTTEGFRDILEIGRHFRPDMYDLQQDKPEPVVPRDRRFGVAERTSAEGDVLREPDQAEVLALADTIGATEAEAVAVCFLNSFVNPSNEGTVCDWLRHAMPGVYVSASYEVCREIREFERTSTVAMNAAAMPLVARYLEEIAPRIRATLANVRILLMQSSGGSLTLAAARDFPARMITSGPAGGALAVQRLGEQGPFRNLLGVDMGGTSTDIALIHDGALRMTTEGEIADRPVKLPMIEINTIGAGAGSIAWLDVRSGLHVGPQSAGAEPGPAAYGNGGTEPTVTDANLVLGRLHPDRFVGGAMQLDIEASRLAIIDTVAKPLDMTLEAAASGIIRIANANMERAMRVSSAEKGYDPRDITLVAFGGAGPMHAAALAKAIGIRTVVVPEHPGVFSAIGLVMSDIRHDFVQTRLARGAEITPDRRRLVRTADLRYVGQAYEVNVSVPEGRLDGVVVAAILENFHVRHKQQYAHNHPTEPVEFVSGRVAATGETNPPPPRAQAKVGAAAGPRSTARSISRRPVPSSTPQSMTAPCSAPVSDSTARPSSSRSTPRRSSTLASRSVSMTSATC